MARSSSSTTMVSLFQQGKFQDCLDRLHNVAKPARSLAVEHNKLVCQLYIAAQAHQSLSLVDSAYYRQLEAWVCGAAGDHEPARPCCPLWRFNLAALCFSAGLYQKALCLLDPHLVNADSLSPPSSSSFSAAASSSSSSSSTTAGRRRGKPEQQFSIRGGGQVRAGGRTKSEQTAGPANERDEANSFHLLLGDGWSEAWLWLTFECLLALGDCDAAALVLDALPQQQQQQQQQAATDDDGQPLLVVARQRVKNAQLLASIEKGAEPPSALPGDVALLSAEALSGRWTAHTAAGALAAAHALYLRGRHQEAADVLLDGDAGTGNHWSRSVYSPACPQSMADTALQAALHSNLCCLMSRLGKPGQAVYHAWQAVGHLSATTGLEQLPPPAAAAVFYNAGIAMLLQASRQSTTAATAKHCLERAMDALPLTPLRALRLTEATIARADSTAAAGADALRFRIAGAGRTRVVQLALAGRASSSAGRRQALLAEALHWCREGLALLSRSVQFEPLLGIALNANAAYLLLSGEQFADALSHARRALADIADCPHPSDKQAAQLRAYRLRCVSYAAESLCRLGQAAEAVDMLTASVEQPPASGSAAAAQVAQSCCYNAAVAHLYCGRFDAAMQWAGKALQLNPICGKTRVLLIYLNLLAGNRLAALDLLGLRS